MSKSNYSLEFIFEGASCKLVITPATVTLVDFYSTTRFRGHGTECLRKVCEWADANGRTIRLTAQWFDFSSSQIMTPDQLVNYYKRFGFVEDSSWAGTFPTRMIRVVR